MNLAFLTLLLGLISGPHPVELSVNGPVAAVELILDGISVRRIEGPPWTAQVDFGPGLKPHELVARAFDKEGLEVASIRQRVNLPRPKAEVEIALEGRAKGAPTTARLTWKILTGEAPSRFFVTFDGMPLEVDAGGRATLPSYDRDSAHILTAEVAFPSLTIAHKDVVFGGQFGSEVSTELTAVSVRLRKGAKMPPVEALQGWFTAGGQTLPVAAVDEGGSAQLLVVRGPQPPEVRMGLASFGGRRGATKFELQIGKADSIRFVSPVPRQFRAGDVQSDLFDISPPQSAKTGGLPWQILALNPKTDHPQNGKRVADAVAVAGLHAVAENHRRAVLLLLGGDGSDASVYDPAVVRRYLALLRVPLIVWTLRGPEKTPAAAAWGPGTEVSTFSKLARAVAEVREELEAQRIVWLEGRHLPQAIYLSPAADGVLEPLPGATP